MHTDTTISALQVVTKVLGTQLRRFQSDIAKTYDTFETDKEYRARYRRKPVGKALKPTIEGQPANGTEAAESTTTADATESGTKYSRRRKEFNLQTYKIHALGDVPSAIMRFGTTDSYSTQIVSIKDHN